MCKIKYLARSTLEYNPRAQVSGQVSERCSNVAQALLMSARCKISFAKCIWSTIHAAQLRSWSEWKISIADYDTRLLSGTRPTGGSRSLLSLLLICLSSWMATALSGASTFIFCALAGASSRRMLNCFNALRMPLRLTDPFNVQG